jgi:hypothetical protein
MNTARCATDWHHGAQPGQVHRDRQGCSRPSPQISGDLGLYSRPGPVLGRGAARYRDSYRSIPSRSEGERDEGCHVAMPLTLAFSQQEADLKASRKAGLTKTFYRGVRVKASIVNGSDGADQGEEHRLGMARRGAARLGRMPRGERSGSHRLQPCRPTGWMVV